MLIRTPSLPPSPPLFRSATSRGTRVLARAQRHFIFAQRYRRRSAPTTWKLCAKRAAPAVRFSFPASRFFLYLLSPCHPIRPSTLVIYRGYAADARGGICTTRNKKKKKRRKRRRREERLPRIRNTIVSPRSSGLLHLRHSASRRSDAMKRSHGSMQRKCTPHNTLIFALAVLMAFSGLAEKLKWKRGIIGESDSVKWKEKIARKGNRGDIGINRREK